MVSRVDEAELIAFGKGVRQRRLALRLSIRQLASQSGLSPSYLSAIETGRNPATDRPPEPSVGVAEQLCRALDLPNPFRTHSSTLGASNSQDHACAHNHVLLYRLDEGHGGLGPLLEEVFRDRVGQWISIADPRAAESECGDAITWTWRFGADPYPDEYLVPDRISEALESQVERVCARVSDESYGIAIADCSAVMRWVVNPEAEIDYEERWVEQSTAVLERQLRRPPALNVCVYRHRDIEALASKIDVLDTILRLFAAHAEVIAIAQDGSVLRGQAAVATILADSRPGGVSASAWRSLSHAAARSYASAT